MPFVLHRNLLASIAGASLTLGVGGCTIDGLAASLKGDTTSRLDAAFTGGSGANIAGTTLSARGVHAGPSKVAGYKTTIMGLSITQQSNRGLTIVTNQSLDAGRTYVLGSGLIRATTAATYLEFSGGASNSQVKMWESTTGLMTVNSVSGNQIAVSLKALQFDPAPLAGNAATGSFICDGSLVALVDEK